MMNKKWREHWKLHPVAALFPRMAPDRFKQFKDDVRAHGYKQKPVLWDSHGQIEVLDGQHRLDAMEALGWPLFGKDGGPNLEFMEVVIDAGGFDPVAEIISRNLQRRDLTPAERVTIWEQARKIEKKSRAGKLPQSERTWPGGKKRGSTKSIVGEAAAELKLDRKTVRKHLSTKAKKSTGKKKTTTKKKAASQRPHALANVENFELIQCEKSIRALPWRDLSPRDWERIDAMVALLLQLTSKRDQTQQHQKTNKGGAR